MATEVHIRNKLAYSFIDNKNVSEMYGHLMYYSKMEDIFAIVSSYFMVFSNSIFLISIFEDIYILIFYCTYKKLLCVHVRYVFYERF